MILYLFFEVFSLFYYFLVWYDLFDVFIEECDDDSLIINVNVFFCVVCECNYVRIIIVYFFNLK